MNRYVEEMCAEATAEGIDRGVLKHAKESTLRMNENGFPDSVIANSLNVDLQTVRQWISESTKTPLC